MSATRDRIRILLAEDQGMVRGAIAALLSLEPDFKIVAEVARGDEVVAAALESSPQIALMDIEMPGIDGLTAIGLLRKAVPACKIIILTTFGRSGYLKRAMEIGASGFLLKDAPVTELARAIRNVLAGGRSVDPNLAVTALSEGTNPLSARERDVLRQAKTGTSIVEIANALYLSPGTVRNHLSAAIQKLDPATAPTPPSSPKKKAGSRTKLFPRCGRPGVRPRLGLEYHNRTCICPTRSGHPA
jgi:two-component system response regulator DesR